LGLFFFSPAERLISDASAVSPFLQRKVMRHFLSPSASLISRPSLCSFMCFGRSLLSLRLPPLFLSIGADLFDQFFFFFRVFVFPCDSVLFSFFPVLIFVIRWALLFSLFFLLLQPTPLWTLFFVAHYRGVCLNS